MFNRASESTEPDAARQRKMLIGGLAGVALLVVLGVVFVVPGLFGGGSSDATAAPIVQHRPKANPTATPSASPSASAPAAPAPVADNVRDPFAKLPAEIAASTAATTATTVPAGSATDGAASGSTTATSATATSGTTPAAGTTSASTSGNTTSTPSSGTAASGGTTSSQAVGKPVQYMSAAGSSAKIEIDSAPYTVTAGQTIAGYRIVSVSPNSISVAHGGKTVKLALGELQTF